jgi:hypothetical protein
MFKNSIKILMSRFQLVWAIIIYYAVVTVILGSLGIYVLQPTIEAIKDSDIYADLIGLFDSIFSGEQTLQGFSGGLMEIYDNVKANVFTRMSVIQSTTAFLFVIAVFARIAYGVIELPTVVMLDGHLSSKASYSFAGKIILHGWRSALQQLIKMLFSLPCDIFIIASVWGLSFLFGVPAVRYFVPFLMILALLLLIPLRLQLFSCWTPGVVADSKKLFAGFFSGVRIAFARGRMRVYSLYFAMVLLIFAIVVFFGIFTLGAGLVVIVPLSILLLNIANTVVYYSYNGKRYYVDQETIITTPIVE